MSTPTIPCTSMSVCPDGLCLNLPGGAAVCLSYPSSGLASAVAGAKMLLAQANVALAPLMPFFDIMDCLNKAMLIIADPTDFLAAVAKVMAMYPPATVPLMVANALDILITYLSGLYAQLQAFVLQMEAIAAAATKATALGCPALALQVDCATGQMALQMASISSGVAPLNALVNTINILLGLVPGAPTIPSFSDLGPDPEAALAPLHDVIVALQTIRALPFFPA